MATVYLAEDTKHQRPVALKVLHPGLAASLGPERFRREITMAARLQHPHILSVYDSGETPSGQLWFTMPYVEGESLRDRLRRDRQLPVDDAVRIAREVADALGYAHDHGVVHRDIKPENILLSGGHALVADFGIARALTPDRTDTSLTGSGIAVGTPAYMSPEQASGDPSLDGRTDVYSLGAVLYEMLVGEPPFTGATARAIVSKMMSQEAPHVRRARPAVSEALDAVIHKALSPVPADRYSSAAAFGAALAATERAGTGGEPVVRGRRVPVAAMALILGFLIGGGLLFAWRTRGGADVANGPVRLAVLPFENIGDSADAYFADGLTDAVRGKLTSVPGLAVIAPASSREYRNTTKSPQQISQELGGVRYLLVGRVRWEKEADGKSRVRVSPALLDASTGTDKWEEPFDAPLTDVFEVQADIAGRVVRAVGVAINGTTRQTLAEWPTANLAAYDAFLRGEAAAQGLSNADPTALARAIAQYEQAVALDSTFAPAWARLAQANAITYFNGTATTPERGEATRRAAERARALAPNRPETHLALGNYYYNVLSDNQRALAEFTAAMPGAPSNADLLTQAALVQQTLGQWDASLVSLKDAQGLDPRDVTTARRLGTTYLWLRRYPDAAVAADRLVALAPDNPSALEVRAMVYVATGDTASARRLIREAPPSIDRGQLGAFFANFWDLYWLLDDGMQRAVLALGPDALGGQSAWATVGAEIAWMRHDTVTARRRAEVARVVFGEILRATPGDGQSRAELALSLAILGRKEEAIAEARQAVALVPIAKDGYSGPYYQHLMARTYLLVGEPERALDALEPLLTVPYFLSPGWLRVDPTFNALRANPRFQRLIAAQ
jgi:eukaryotic-like serine/threonine-protein kinase